jgi:hypothetical protein
LGARPGEFYSRFVRSVQRGRRDRSARRIEHAEAISLGAADVLFGQEAATSHRVQGNVLIHTRFHPSNPF